MAAVYALLYGMITIVKATAMATHVSRERAASLNNGLLGLPTALSRAVSPSALAALWVGNGSYTLGLSVMCAVATLAVVAFWFAQRRAQLWAGERREAASQTLLTLTPDRRA